jgi:hypothetical protein
MFIDVREEGEGVLEAKLWFCFLFRTQERRSDLTCLLSIGF